MTSTSKSAAKIKNSKMRELSGNVKSSDPLVDILYTLMRDGHVSPSNLEIVVRERNDSVKKAGVNGSLEVLFTNGWLANYAINLSDRIREGPELPIF